MQLGAQALTGPLKGGGASRVELGSCMGWSNSMQLGTGALRGDLKEGEGARGDRQIGRGGTAAKGCKDGL
eukprot:355323-Chlamydomonas_euryale.AAC.3